MQSQVPKISASLISPTTNFNFPNLLLNASAEIKSPATKSSPISISAKEKEVKSKVIENS